MRSTKVVPARQKTGLLRLLIGRRPSSDLWFLTLCQALAVAIVTGLLLFTERVQQAIYDESAAMLAGDLVIQSSRPIDHEWQRVAAASALTDVRSVRFTSMLFVGEQMQLTDIRAVSAGYPLRGELSAAESLGHAPQLQRDGPEPGTLWLDEQAAAQLQAAVGDSIEVGRMALRFARVLHDEPGSALPSMGLSGRALMHLDDVAQTGLVQPGSRVTYSWLLAGSADAIERFRRWLEPHLSVHESLRSHRDGDERTQKILQRATSFLNLGGAVAVLLAGIAAMMTAARYMAMQQDRVAILRALGVGRRSLLLAYVSQFASYAGLALIVGWAVGYGGQAASFYLLRDWLQAPVVIGPEAFFAGAVTLLFCLLCFALPTLLGLMRVSPMRLLRATSSSAGQGWGVIVFAAGFFLLMVFYSSDWWSAALVYGGILALAGVVWMLVQGLVAVLRRLLAGSLAESWSLAWLTGLRAFCRQTQTMQLRTVLLAATITLLAVIVSLRSGLLREWQTQLPVLAPNYFALNVLPEDAAPFAEALRAQGYLTEPLYPVARARLQLFNGVSAREHNIVDADTLASLEREMVLTESQRVPPSNTVIDGRWHGDIQSAEYAGSAVGEMLEVSVEYDYAQRLGVELGDVLTFSFAGQQFDVRVSSFRQLNWNSMKPNFYFVLEPPALQQFPYTYMTSFYAPAAQSGALADISRQFPALSLIDIGQIVERAQGILNRAGLAVQAIAVVTVVAGLLVVVASLRASLDSRAREQCVMRALGAPRRLLLGAMLVELVVTALVAALTGLAAAALILDGLAARVFDLPLQLAPVLWLWLPLVVLVVVLLVGLWVLTPVLRHSPLQIWRGGGRLSS